MPDPDDGRAAALAGCAMTPVIATAMVTVAIPMSAVRALVSLRNIRFMLFSPVGWLASAPWPGPDGAKPSRSRHEYSDAV